MKTLLLLIALVSVVFGYQADSVAQWGATFYFNTNYEVGTFANGDYWVVGPVTLDSITPREARYGAHGFVNGWDINPMPVDSQPLDYRIGRHSKPDTTFPEVIPAGSSVLKVISREPYSDSAGRPSINTGIILTVVASIPANNGVKFFRPPYIGTEKPYYDTTDLRTELLPSLADVEADSSLTYYWGQLKYAQVDHTKYSSQYIKPKNAMPYYGADVNRRNGDAILRLFLDDPVANKLPLLIGVVQGGIDYYHNFKNGNNWIGNGGGELPGNFLPMVFASYMLNNTAMIDLISDSAALSYENRCCYFNGSGTALWGHEENPGQPSEQVYWNKLLNHSASGSSTLRDPYRQIDGGYEPNSGYQQCCTSQPFKATAMILDAMPALKDVWNPTAMLSYANRWVTHGAWTIPDTCAPHTLDTVVFLTGANTDSVKLRQDVTRTTVFQLQFRDTIRGVVTYGYLEWAHDTTGTWTKADSITIFTDNSTEALNHMAITPSTSWYYYRLRTNLATVRICNALIVYTIRYGPVAIDANMECITNGSIEGRFPEIDGAGADGGAYGSNFVDALWTRYYGTSAPQAQKKYSRTKIVRTQ